MKLKQLLLSALAMVAVATGYAQDISSIVKAEQGITVYDYNNDWNISSRISYYDNGVPDQDNSYTIYFESESEIEVSFDIDVVTDDNAYLHISFSDGTETSIDYADGRHITHSFEAGENNISFTYGRWDYMVSDEWGPIVMDQRAEVYNIIVKGLCAHEFPEESTYPATCTEPSKSECIKCGKLLSDNHSAALGHDFDADGKCQREGCGLVDARMKVLSSDFVSISIEDNEYPWEYYESEEDGTKGLRSTNKSQNNTSSETTITLSSDEYDFTFSFDLSVSSEEHYDYMYIYVDGDEEYDAYASGIVSDSRLYNFEKGSSHTIRLVYSKDGSGNSIDDRGYISNIKIEKVTQIPDLRPNAISIGEGVEATFTLVDNDNPWKLVDESDPSKGLTNCSTIPAYDFSILSLQVDSKDPFVLAFDYVFKSNGPYAFYFDQEGYGTPIFSTQSSCDGTLSHEYTAGTHDIKIEVFNIWGDSSLGDNGAVISNLRLVSTLDHSKDGRIEVDDLTGLIESKRGIPGGFEEIKGKIETIVDFILNKE